MKRTISQTVTFHASVRDIEIHIQPPPKSQQLDEDLHEQPVEEAGAPADSSVDSNSLAAILAQINERIESIDAARAHNLCELQELAIELAVAIASHIVKTRLDAHQLNLDELVQSAIAQLVPAEKITVRINPLDRVDLKQCVDEPFTQLSQKIDIVDEQDLPRGACLVTGDDHGMISTLESRLENIRDTLLEGIEYARIERRKAIDTSGTLRRFPDRRKLA